MELNICCRFLLVCNFKLDSWLECFEVLDNDRNDSSPCVYIKNMSSINLFHRRNMRWAGENESNACSSALINIFANEGAILVPIAVPCFCFTECPHASMFSV